MGWRLACTHQPPALRRVRPSPAALLLSALVLGVLSAPQVSDAMLNEDRPERVTCDVGNCWSLVQMATETLGIRDLYPQSSGYEATPEERDLICVAVRTFYHCIQNMTQPCRGDLSFHSVQQVIEQQFKTLNCSRKGRVYVPGPAPDTPVPPRHPVCSYRGPPPLALCSVYGDPHFRTLNGQHQTCRVAGAWSLLDNDYLTIMATSERYSEDTQATVLTKVTIIIKARDECTSEDYATYQAPDQQGALPAAFDDGRVHFGPQKSVQIEEREEGSHIEIYLRYIDTRIVLRRYGRFLSLAFTTPKILVEEARSSPVSLQLCLHGCPDSQQLHLADVLSHRQGGLVTYAPQSPATPLPQSQVAAPSTGRRITTMSTEAAQARCRNSHLVDMYLDNCVFDLISTGDLNFTLMAHNAMQDTLRLLPEELANFKNRTVVQQPESTKNGAPSSTNLHYLHRTMYTLLYVTAIYLCLSAQWTAPSVIL